MVKSRTSETAPEVTLEPVVDEPVVSAKSPARGTTGDVPSRIADVPVPTDSDLTPMRMKPKFLKLHIRK